MSETETTTIQMPDPARLVVSNSPHIRDNQSIHKIMFTVVLAMLPACLAGIWFFGLAAVKVLLLCTVSCVVIEEGWNKLVKRASTWKDGSAILTGILLGMNLNAGVPWWVCVLGGILAIILGKQLFGGLGYNPFNPALVARVGLLIGMFQRLERWWWIRLPPPHRSDWSQERPRSGACSPETSAAVLAKPRQLRCSLAARC